MPKGAKFGGRVTGTPNKATAEVKALAREYGLVAIERLAELAGLRDGISPAANAQGQIVALRELLDRGYRRSVQPLGPDPDEPIQDVINNTCRRPAKAANAMRLNLTSVAHIEPGFDESSLRRRGCSRRARSLQPRGPCGTAPNYRPVSNVSW